MGVTGDRYEGTFDGNRIELVRNNLDKTLSLSVNGVVVASETRWLPRDITLQAEFEHQGRLHRVVAHQQVRPLFGLPLATDDSIEIDGTPLPLMKTS